MLSPSLISPLTGAGRVASKLELALVDLNFTKVLDYDHSILLPPDLIDLNETFDADTGQFTKYTEGVPGTTEVTGNAYVITHVTGSAKNDIIVENGVDLALPQFWTEVQVHVDVTGATSYDNGGVGLVKDANNFIFASMDRLASTVRLQIKIGGTNTFLGSLSQAFGTSFKLGLSLVGNSASVWIDTGSGWVYKTGASVSSYYNFQTDGNLTGWHPGFTLANGGGNSTWSFSNFKFGRHGGVGIRDLTLVSQPNGKPYFPTPGHVLLMCTLTDNRGAGYQGIINLDLSDYSYKVQAVLMVDRGGAIRSDLAGHIIAYPNGDRRLTISTWGNNVFGGETLEVLHKLETSADLLTGSHVVSGMTALSLPSSGTNPGEYDATLVWDAKNARWFMAYVIVGNVSSFGTAFYPAQAYSTDLSSWTALGSDQAGANTYEGAKVDIINGDIFMTVGGPQGSGNTARVYDSEMNYQGTLDAVFEGGTQTQPHAMVFPYGNKQICVSFDNTAAPNASGSFTWGNLVIYEASRY